MQPYGTLFCICGHFLYEGISTSKTWVNVFYIYIIGVYLRFHLVILSCFFLFLLILKVEEWLKSWTEVWFLWGIALPPRPRVCEPLWIKKGGGGGTWESRDCVKGRAAEARDLVFSARSCSEPITSLGLMMSQSSITGPAMTWKTMFMNGFCTCHTSTLPHSWRSFYCQLFALKKGRCSYCPLRASHPSWAPETVWRHWERQHPDPSQTARTGTFQHCCDPDTGNWR